MRQQSDSAARFSIPHRKEQIHDQKSPADKKHRAHQSIDERTLLCVPQFRQSPVIPGLNGVNRPSHEGARVDDLFVTTPDAPHFNSGPDFALRSPILNRPVLNGLFQDGYLNLLAC
jgi:hypothetical protein